MQFSISSKKMNRKKRDINLRDDSSGVPPVPIPNTEVKPTYAESTCLETDWEDRELRSFFLALLNPFMRRYASLKFSVTYCIYAPSIFPLPILPKSYLSLPKGLRKSY